MIKVDNIKQFYEKRYKLLMLIPIILLIFSFAVLGYWKINTGEFLSKDITMKGGIIVTVNSDESIDLASMEKALSSKLESSVSVKAISSIGTGGVIGYSFETESKIEKDLFISTIGEVTGLDVTAGKYTVESSSPALGASFFKSTIKAIIIGFIFMSIVVFIYFRKIIPSLAVIQSAAFDIFCTMAFMNILGIKLSGGSVAAILMIIGYSVDTDILLATRVLKRESEGDLNSRIYSSIKTGLTMQLTTLSALSVMYILSPASTLKTIALVLLIGVAIDLITTWITNVGMLRWYLEKKHAN